MNASTPLLILPCAGFGKRTGQESSKELLPGPDGRLLIEFSLGLAEEFGLDVLIAIRPQKKDLMNYLRVRSWQTNYELLMTEATREWPETVLRTKDLWRDQNILCLPDTRFAPVSALTRIQEELLSTELVFATHSVSNPSAWGLVWREGTTGKDFSGVEKPVAPVPMAARAWGLIGFKASVGEVLFQNLLTSTLDHIPYRVEARASMLELESFADYGRDPKQWA